MENYYQILGVPDKASESEIKKAYRQLAKEWHPDKHQGKETLVEAETKFKTISEAYSVLSDQKRRQEYDYLRSTGRSFGFGGGHYKAAGDDPFEFMREDLFANFRRARQTGPMSFPGQHVQMQQSITLSEALFGASKSVRYSVKTACQPCKGLGALEFTTCSVCKGLGSTVQDLGSMKIQTGCFACNSSGKTPAKPCETCKGQRVLGEERNVTVQVPPNMPHGAKLRMRGAGGAGSEGMQPGDLVLEIIVQYPNSSKYTEEERETLKSLLGRQ